MILELTVAVLFVVQSVINYKVINKIVELDKKPTEDMTIRHAKSSLRNPLKTFDLEYSKYKGTSGLYEPTSPKRE